ncbi:hypothetical protein CB1_000327064 [Camelus ferus]|nr:hypothetical protein CB1_000327064 [Camelus ferus]
MSGTQYRLCGYLLPFLLVSLPFPDKQGTGLFSIRTTNPRCWVPSQCPGGQGAAVPGLPEVSDRVQSRAVPPPGVARLNAHRVALQLRQERSPDSQRSKSVQSWSWPLSPFLDQPWGREPQAASQGPVPRGSSCTFGSTQDTLGS